MKMTKIRLDRLKRARWDSNPRSPASEADALSAGLRALTVEGSRYNTLKHFHALHVCNNKLTKSLCLNVSNWCFIKSLQRVKVNG